MCDDGYATLMCVCHVLSQELAHVACLLAHETVCTCVQLDACGVVRNVLRDMLCKQR